MLIVNFAGELQMAFDAGGNGGSALPVLVVGTGFSGLGMGIKLKEAGIESFTILEKAQDVGGTWRDNRYPGCACDVQSHLYSFSFAQNPEWTRMFAPQPEIESYLQGVARRYALYPHIRFGAEVVEARWDGPAAVWRVRCRDGREFAARALVAGTGGLSTPAYPDLPGIEKFQGEAFHSADWNHDYDLRGKRVAVIGTGASAVQFVPQIARDVGRLDLYQRTPPWIMPKPDREIGPRERAIYRRFPLLQKLFRGALWTMLESRVLGFVFNPKVMKLVELVARKHIRSQIADPVLRAKVTPSYTIGCKRVLISDDYYPALARPNVEVITHGIREVRAHSIVASDGTERPIDAIIYGTGFKAQDPIPHGLLFGRGGRDIHDSWPEGPEAYKGTVLAGFPNFFMLMGPNTGLGHSSMVYMIESQIAYVMQAIKALRDGAIETLEVRPDAQSRFNARLQARLAGAVWTRDCKSWYINASGRNTTLWPGFTFVFRRMTRRFDLANYVTVAARRAETV